MTEQGRGRGEEPDGVRMLDCVGLQQVDRATGGVVEQGSGDVGGVYLLEKHYFLRKMLA